MTRPTPPRGLAAALVVMRTTSTGAPRGRRLIGLLLLTWLPVAVQVLAIMLSDSGREQGFNSFAEKVNTLYLAFILPLSMIFLGTATFGDEWAGGTAHYVVGLPLSRAALVLGRWLAAVRRGLLLVIPPVLIYYVLAMTGYSEALTHYLPELLSTVLVLIWLTMTYAAVFLLFGGFLRRAVMVSFIYVFVFEMLTAFLPQNFAALSMGFHARNILFQVTGNENFRLNTTNLLAEEPMGAAWSVLWVGVTGAIALLLATLALRSKESGGEAASADAAST